MRLKSLKRRRLFILPVLETASTAPSLSLVKDQPLSCNWDAQQHLRNYHLEVEIILGPDP